MCQPWVAASSCGFTEGCRNWKRCVLCVELAEPWISNQRMWKGRRALPLTSSSLSHDMGHMFSFFYYFVVIFWVLRFARLRHEHRKKLTLGLFILVGLLLIWAATIFGPRPNQSRELSMQASVVQNAHVFRVMAYAWKSYSREMRWIEMNAIFKMCTHDLERIQISSHLLQIVRGYQKLTGPDQRTFRNNLARRHDPRSAAIADYQVVARCSKFSTDGFPAKDLHDSLKYIGMWDRIFPVRIWIPLCENGQGQVQSWDAWLQGHAIQGS